MSGHHDIFFCHDQASATLVKRISGALAARGISCFIHAGHSLSEINHKLAISKVFLGLGSSSFFENRNCQIHLTIAWLAAQKDHPDHPSRILLLNPEENSRHIYPLLFKDRVIADAEDIEDLQSLAMTLHDHCRAVTGTIGEFYPEPMAPCIEPYDQHDREPIGFSGRNREIWDMHACLLEAAAKGTNTPVVLSGPNGQGKTLLALEYAFRFGSAYPGGIFRISAREAEPRAKLLELAFNAPLKAQLLALLRRLEPETPQKEQDSLESIRNSLAAILQNQNLPFLWIVDDLPDGLNGPALNQWLAPSPESGHSLLISNNQRYDTRGNPIHIPLLGEASALSALVRERPPNKADEIDALHWMTDEVGRHALFAGFLRGLMETTISDRRSGYTKLAHRIGRRSRQSAELVTLWPSEFPEGREKSGANLLIEVLSILNGPARDILRLAFKLSPSPIPLSLIQDSLLIAGMGPDDRKEDLFTIFLNEPEETPLSAEDAETYVREGVAQIVQLGLGFRLCQSIELTPLAVRTFQKISPPSPRTAILAEATLQALYKLSEDCHDKEVWDRLSAVAPHARELLSNLRDSSIGPDNSPAEITGKIRLSLHIADLDLQLGGKQRALSGYRNTSAYLVRAMAQDPHNSARQRDFARVQEQLGDLLEESGNHQDALDHYRKSLGIRSFMAKQESAPPEIISETLRLNRKIASIQRRLGDAEAALQTQQAAHALLLLQLKATPQSADLEFEIASSHAQQGELYIRLKQTEDSLREFKKALPIFERLAAQAPDLLRYGRAPTAIHNRIGDILHSRDDLTGALERYRTALAYAGSIALHFPEHRELQRDLAQCHDNIGDTLLGLDDSQEANEQFKRFLEIAEHESNRPAFSGLRSREIASVHIKLGRIRELDKRLRLALDRYTRARTIIERLAMDFPENQKLREDFQWLRHKIGRLAERIEADDRRIARNQAQSSASPPQEGTPDSQGCD